MNSHFATVGSAAVYTNQSQGTFVGNYVLQLPGVAAPNGLLLWGGATSWTISGNEFKGAGSGEPGANALYAIVLASGARDIAVQGNVFEWCAEAVWSQAGSSSVVVGPNWIISPQQQPQYLAQGAGALFPSNANGWGIGAEPWLTPMLAAGWSNWGGSYAIAAYYKDGAGIVHVKGLVKYSGANASGLTIFTLPPGYRPSETHQFAANNWTGTVSQHGDVDVAADGSVISQAFSQNGANAGNISLSEISFRAEQ